MRLRSTRAPWKRDPHFAKKDAAWQRLISSPRKRARTARYFEIEALRPVVAANISSIRRSAVGVFVSRLVATLKIVWRDLTRPRGRSR
jgi:hypothetical protein